jgi:hypothetical protein
MRRRDKKKEIERNECRKGQRQTGVHTETERGVPSETEGVQRDREETTGGGDVADGWVVKVDNRFGYEKWT